MRTLKLTIAYDGTRYEGWQTQRRRAAGPTVQGALEQVLRQILQEPVTVVGSGRTDAGVHAAAQVAHVKTRSAISVPRLLRSVNQLLPPDIAVTRLAAVRASFHARFDAVRKRYRYRLFTGEVVPPFIRPYVYHVRAPLSLSGMRREAAALLGRHDFGAFARARKDGGTTPSTRYARSGSSRATSRGTTTRAITRLSLRRQGQEIYLDVEGDGFLHTMVRTIAGTLVDVGRGHLPAGTLRRMLRTKRRKLAGIVAPARGLTLVSVRYAQHASRVAQGCRAGLAVVS